MKLASLFLAGVLIAGLAGCGTLVNVYGSEPKVYGGLRWDFDEIPLGLARCDPGCLCVFDVPFSLVFDTVTLPYTALREIFR